jgi:hypothetical protein
LRTTGFAYAIKFYSLLSFVPFIGDLMTLLVFALSLVGFWIAGVQAHRLRGWRSLVFPFAVIVIFLLSIFIIDVLFGGAVLTLENIAHSIGMTP